VSRAQRRPRRDKRLTLGQHLAELRSRALKSAIAVGAGTIVGWLVNGDVLDAIAAPIRLVSRSNHLATMNFSSVTSAFDIRMQIAITVGVIISSPMWLYQILAFFVPGLTPKETRYTFGFLLTAIPVFLSGCVAGWFVFPHVVELLNSFVPNGGASFLQADDYLSFVLKLVVAVGVAFVLPVFLVFLNFMSILPAKTILHGWRVALLMICTFCAIATPAADILDMFLLMLSMASLYLLAVGITWWHDKRMTRRMEALSADTRPDLDMAI
jgi:sec-independent protein translocase protein TatC